MERMFINQPSSSDSLHSMHGVKVLVEGGGRGFIARVWPVSGSVVSLEIPRYYLGRGWPSEKWAGRTSSAHSCSCASFAR